MRTIPADTNAPKSRPFSVREPSCLCILTNDDTNDLTGVFASDSDSDHEEQVASKIKKNVQFVSSKQEDDSSAKSESSRWSRPARSFAGFDGHRQTNEIGKWQKHTTGIGSKLLSKMGWDPGKGLGKNLQGIAVPIEAAGIRVAGMGIGAAGPEKKQDALFAETRPSSPHSAGKSSNSSKEKVRKNYVFKSVDDLINEEIGMGTFSDSIMSNTKVVDMRGPECKVLSGYHEIWSSEDKSLGDGTSETEKKIRDVEKTLVKNGRDVRKTKDRLQVLEDDKKHVDVEMRRESDRLERLTDLTSIVTKLKLRNQESKVTCSDLILIYTTLLRKFTAEVNQFQLHDMLALFFMEVSAKELKDWDMFAHTMKHKELFTDLQRLLLEHNPDLYDSILWEVWTPLFRRQFLSFPSLKHPEDVINFLEAWQYLLPKWLLDNLLEQVVIPALGEEVEKWDPLTDPVPVHSWIHPWLLLMDGHSLEPLYRVIRDKLARALSIWYPSDMSAKIILQPWKGVMSQSSLDDFFSVHVLPKLEDVMSSFQVSANLDTFEPCSWIMWWHDLITDQAIGSLLVRHFFPKWLHVLYEWLLYSPNFDAIYKWYTGWKSQIPESVASLPAVRDCLNKGLEMMDFAVSSPFGMAAYNFNASQPIAPQVAATAEQLRFMNGILSGSTQSTESMNFKQMLSRKADESGILFMPINKLQDGKQVYSLGQHKVYLDRSVIFVYRPSSNSWTPASLQSLLQ